MHGCRIDTLNFQVALVSQKINLHTRDGYAGPHLIHSERHDGEEESWLLSACSLDMNCELAPYLPLTALSSPCLELLPAWYVVSWWWVQKRADDSVRFSSIFRTANRHRWLL